MIVDYILQTSNWTAVLPWHAGIFFACIITLFIVFASGSDEPPQSTPGMIAFIVSFLGFVFFGILLLVSMIAGMIEDQNLRRDGYREVVTQAGYADVREGEGMDRWLAYKDDTLVEVFVEDLGNNEFLVTEIPRG